MLYEPPRTSPTLQGKHLTRTFGQGETLTTALNDLSLEMYPGQINLLMGPSGSGKQRVAIGRALIKDPMFCFADEPTSALDWAHGEQVVELLRAAAHERGATILIVGHDARIIPYVDRVFDLEDGCLREPEDITAYPPGGRQSHGPYLRSVQ